MEKKMEINDEIQHHIPETRANIPRLTADDDRVFLSHLESLEAMIGYEFKDRNWAREALVGERREVLVGGRKVLQGNQRLALLGDTTLKTIYWDNWLEKEELVQVTCQRYDRLGSNRELCRVGRYWGIDTMVVDAHDVPMQCGEVDVASAVEAILGAIYKDSDGDKAGLAKAVHLLMDSEFFTG